MITIKPRLKKVKKIENAGSPESSYLDRIGRLPKRAFDFIAALIGLVFLSPFFALIAILIKRDSPGPVLYLGPRIGKHGIKFNMLKFRTMYETPESYRGLRITCKEDNRITPIGRWLRDTKLNELPQLWNVLIGEMSLVGPRPEDPSISKTWPTKIAQELLSVRPGVTSPASVVYRDEENMFHAGEVMRKYLHELSPDKMRLDQLYIRYRSFWLDLDVILWTVLLLIPKIKEFSPPENLLFVGPVSRFIQRYFSWFLWDFLIVIASILISSIVVGLFGPLNFSLLKIAIMALGYSLLNNLVGFLLKTNRINWPKASSWETGRLISSWMVSTTVILFLHFLLGFTSLQIYGVLIGGLILSLFGIIFIRYRGRLLNGLLSRILVQRLHKLETRERVLIVGSGRMAEQISWLMEHPTYSRKFQIVGYIDNDLKSQGMKIYGSKVVGNVDEIQEIIRKLDVGLLILADNNLASGKYKQFHNTAIFFPAKIVVAPDLFGSLNDIVSRLTTFEANDNLDGFQCQYCLARYSSKHEQCP